MEIVLSKCKLRCWKADDAESLVNNANTGIWAKIRDAFPNPYTLNDARRWIEILPDTNKNIFSCNRD